MFGLARGLNPSSDRREWWPCGLIRTIDPRHFYPTIESAVQAYRRETGAEWCKAL